MPTRGVRTRFLTDEQVTMLEQTFDEYGVDEIDPEAWVLIKNADEVDIDNASLSREQLRALAKTMKRMEE